MKRKIAWTVVSCLMVASLLLVSCAAEEEEEVAVEEEEVVAPEEEEVAPEEEEVATVAEAPKYGGELITTGYFLNFDEALGYPFYNFTIDLIYEELLIGDWAKGPAGKNEVTWTGTTFYNVQYETGCLAESWEITDDQTVVFHIRKGVHWHDKPPTNGRELTADDVAFSINRLLFEYPASFAASILPEKPESITALDDWTVEVVTPPGKLGPVMEKVGEWMHIVPRDAVEEFGDLQEWQNSLGTGPFMLIDFVDMSSATVVRNPNYWMKDPIHPENTLPYVDGIKMLVIEDASTIISAMRTGKIDRLGMQSYMNWDDLMTRSQYDLQWATTFDDMNGFICMRTDLEPYDDIRVRRALMLAIDNQLLVDSLQYGYGEVLSYPIAPVKEFMDMYTPLDELPEEIRELYEYHPDKARELLAEAGYPNGFKTEVLCPAGWEEFGSIIMEWWADIGVEMVMDVKEGPVYLSMSARRKYEHMVSSSSGLFQPFSMEDLRPGSLTNKSLVDDVRVNEAYDAIAAAFFDEAERREIMKEIALYIQSQVWSIALPTRHEWSIWQPWLKGYHGELSPGPLNTNKWQQFIWIDQDLKEELTGKR